MWPVLSGKVYILHPAGGVPSPNVPRLPGLFRHGGRSFRRFPRWATRYRPFGISGDARSAAWTALTALWPLVYLSFCSPALFPVLVLRRARWGFPGERRKQKETGNSAG